MKSGCPGILADHPKRLKQVSGAGGGTVLKVNAGGKFARWRREFMKCQVGSGEKGGGGRRVNGRERRERKEVRGGRGRKKSGVGREEERGRKKG